MSLQQRFGTLVRVLDRGKTKTSLGYKSKKLKIENVESYPRTADVDYGQEWEKLLNVTHLEQGSDLLLHSCLSLRALGCQVSIGHHTQLENRKTSTEIMCQALE